jgi:hypothetical protein
VTVKHYKPDPVAYPGEYLKFEIALQKYYEDTNDGHCNPVLAVRMEARDIWVNSGRHVPEHIKFAEPKQDALATQPGGDHYKGRKIQPVEYIEANDLRFLEGCIIKRATRHGEKTGAGVKDLEKIIHEARLIAQLRYGVDI